MGEDAVLHPHQEDGRELEALGRVQRHQRDPAPVVLDLVGVGDEGHRLEELVEGVVVDSRPHELGDVLEPPAASRVSWASSSAT